MLSATADTNILVSGLNFRRGNPFELLNLARTGKINLTVSSPILDEMAEVLARKFNWPSEDIEEARRRIRSMARTVSPVVHLDVIKNDPSDNRILECAVSAGSSYIVTGDNHLLSLRTYDSIRILNVSEFLSLLANQH